MDREKHEKKKFDVKTIARIGVMTALIVIMAQISFPLPSGIPVTLQTFGIALAGFLLGPLYGFISVALYLVLGIAGVPVFANFKSGFGAIIGLTGGYLWGFLPFALLCGLGYYFFKKKLIVLTPVLPLVGLAICHLCGLIQFCFVKGTIDLPSFISAFSICSGPYLIKDIVSILAAFFLVFLLRKRAPKVFGDY